MADDSTGRDFGDIDNRSLIVSARKAARVSQAELAKRVGAHWITISRLERGLIPATSDWVTRIVKALNIDEDGIQLRRMRSKGFRVIGTIEPKSRVVAVSKNTIFRAGNVLSGESAWYAVYTNDWEPIARIGDVIRFSRPDSTEWVYANGRICLAVGRRKRNIICGILRSEGSMYEDVSIDQYRLEDISGRILLQMPFHLVGVATAILYQEAMRLPTKPVDKDTAEDARQG